MLGSDVLVPAVGRLRFDVLDGDGGPVLWASDWTSNLITTAGKQFFLDAADGAAARTLSNAQGGLLIGDGSTAPAVGDTNLAGTNKFRQALDATFPSRTGTTVTYQFTVATGSANFVHNEFGLTNASSTALSDGVLITHLLAGPFTKTAAVSIIYTYALSQA